ncbi:unnamed protein product [Ectocarpus sp. 6 AP-2014]|uniref:Nucleoid-associated protein n=1 Tax=Ectocarpus siliculosus TaxID=2880 RepID=D8LKH7_ECTSI|nr:conserved unknown protein [Ectocarpus siliculosus]|eukprot:CBN74567.1 conserved unknown protein [Ectocarpus siliculosus]
MKVTASIATAVALLAPAQGFVISSSFVGAQHRCAAKSGASTTARPQQPAMLFGGGGAKPAEGGGGEKKDGGFNMGNMMEGLKKANEIGQKTKDLQKDLELLKVEGKSPCGMVTVTVTGQQMPLSCDISEEAMAEGAKAVAEKVAAAQQAAHTESLQTMSKRLAELYSEMGLPVGAGGGMPGAK